MQTMQACIPFNLACLAIATLYYTWRDLYIPRQRHSEQLRERVSRLLWAAASHKDSVEHARPESAETNMFPSPQVPEPSPSLDDLDESDETRCKFAIYRGVECRACRGRHTFHDTDKSSRPAGSTFQFTCPEVQKTAWIWWLGKPEQIDELPADVVRVNWVAGA